MPALWKRNQHRLSHGERQFKAQGQGRTRQRQARRLAQRQEARQAQAQGRQRARARSLLERRFIGRWSGCVHLDVQPNFPQGTERKFVYSSPLFQSLSGPRERRQHQ